MKNRLFAGVDIGSTTTKCVLIDEDRQILDFNLIYTGADRNSSGKEVIQQSLKKLGLDESAVARTVATGYGRHIMADADDSSPEIICHAKGTAFLRPGTRTIIDIGGQDSKVIALDEYGFTEKFEMNDKCAAGTGRFFEVLSGRLLGEELSSMAQMSLEANRPCSISSMCTIFAESEIISLLSEGESKANIVAGMNLAVAKRVTQMAKRCMGTLQEDIVFTGGVANSEGVRRAMEEQCGKPVYTLDRPQITGCMGAALIALEQAEELGL